MINNTGLYFIYYMKDAHINCHNNCNMVYLRVTITCSYIYLQFWLKTRFVSTKICNLYEEMVQDRHNVMFYSAYG